MAVFHLFDCFGGSGNLYNRKVQSNFGRTHLKIGVSGATFDTEADFDIRLAVAPPKPHKISEKKMFDPKRSPICFLTTDATSGII